MACCDKLNSIQRIDNLIESIGNIQSPNPSQSDNASIPKLDIHNHILPKHIPDFRAEFGYGEEFITLKHDKENPKTVIYILSHPRTLINVHKNVQIGSNVERRQFFP